MSNVKQAFEFAQQVLPDLLGFGHDLFRLFNGDVDAAKGEISDRRADIERRRARTDAGLQQKYKHLEDKSTG